MRVLPSVFRQDMRLTRSRRKFIRLNFGTLTAFHFHRALRETSSGMMRLMIHWMRAILSKVQSGRWTHRWVSKYPNSDSQLHPLPGRADQMFSIAEIIPWSSSSVCTTQTPPFSMSFRDCYPWRLTTLPSMRSWIVDIRRSGGW